jgi:beta-lactamase class A
MPFALFVLVLGAFADSCRAGELRTKELGRELQALTHGFDGRVGVCVQGSNETACVRGDERFSLQSVIKLVVGIAVMDAVDHLRWSLDEPVVVRKQDLSLFVQPIKKLVTDKGYTTTTGDLVRRAIVDSDSAAVDILIAKLGGPMVVQACLARKNVKDVRVDRDEKHLQTEILGFEWKPEYVDAALFEKARAAVPEPRRAAAYRRYQTDPRDTATPRGMAFLLYQLAHGKLLSESSTKYLMDVMKQTATFPDRLKAGLAPGWTLAHKTGTSGEWAGITAATNDVGVLIAPDGGMLSVAVFIGDSRAPMKDRAALMAKISAAAIKSYK